MAHLLEGADRREEARESRRPEAEERVRVPAGQLDLLGRERRDSLDPPQPLEVLPRRRRVDREATTRVEPRPGRQHRNAEARELEPDRAADRDPVVGHAEDRTRRDLAPGPYDGDVRR